MVNRRLDNILSFNILIMSFFKSQYDATPRNSHGASSIRYYILSFNNLSNLAMDLTVCIVNKSDNVLSFNFLIA